MMTHVITMQLFTTYAFHYNQEQKSELHYKGIWAYVSSYSRYEWRPK